MILHAHPTDADYKHALAAHETWVHFSGNTTAWRNPLTYFWFLCIGGMAILAISPELISSSEWSINATSLLAQELIFPMFWLMCRVEAAMASRAVLRPKNIGILERKIDENGGFQIVASRGQFGWIVLLLAVPLYLFFSHQPGNASRNAPPPAIVKNMPEDKSSKPPQPLSGGFLFTIGLLAWGMATTVTQKLQKSRQTKNLLISTPSLILPKTWETTEHWIAERSELIQTTMQWEFIRKFLETPTVVLLYPNEQSFYLIPKAAFTSELELAEFMGLLMRKVPNGVMQPREARGFTVQPVPAIPLSEENRH